MANLLIPQDTAQAKEFSKLAKEGKIRRLYQGIYTKNLKDPIENITLTHWMDITPAVVKQGVLSHRTAIDLKPAMLGKQFIVFVTSTYNKTITLPGLTIAVSRGDNKQFLERILPGLEKSNIPRALLENLSIVKSTKYKGIKTIGVSGVEDFLAKELRFRHEEALNQIRDEAKSIAQTLGYTREYKKLNDIVSALLATHSNDNLLQSKFAKAISQKKPFDSNRINLFEELIIYLKKCRFLERDYTYQKTSFNNLSFYESYFSNFIEGTEFLIEEAEEIVFKGKEIDNRHADSHDILANFRLNSDFSEMNITPKSADELVSILKTRHAYLMKERPEKRPGHFKIKPNKAGNTYFVLPEEVSGTLSQGFEQYQTLNDGLEKAVFMHFLISEIHPFDDGNGRLARIMMNAELVRSGLYKIMIPSVHRDNYLNGLRLASRDHEFRLYCKVIDQAQAYTASINWLDYGEAREKIEQDNANLFPDEGLPTFNRALRQLKLSDLSS